MDNQIFVFLVFGAMGLYSLTLGTRIRSGRSKIWFLQKSYPVIAPRAIVFALIPTGIVFLLMAVTIWIPDIEARGKTFVYGCAPTLFISLSLAMWQPRWLLPPWYRRLLDEHEDIIHLLEEEARKLGGEEWERLASTQESLEAWVAEVRHKYGLEKH
jgi:hypothetical protein